MGPFAEGEFWVLIAFVVSMGVVAWKATPLLTGMLDQRAQRIRHELDEVNRLRADAERTLATYREKQRVAMDEAAAIVASARAEAERAAAAAARELDAALERRRRMAGEKVALEEAQAVAAVRSEAVEVAIAAVRRALASELDETRRAQLIDEAIAALPQGLH